MNDALRQLFSLGRDHYLRRDYASARTYLEQIAEKSQAFADVYNMLGVIYHDAGQFSKAEAALTRALDLNPAYTEAALNLAVLYNDIGKYVEAKQTYAVALARAKRKPGDLDPHVAGKIANMHADLAEAYRAVGRTNEAVGEYRKAIELGPAFIDLRTRLAATLREAGHLEPAINELRRVLDEKPEHAPARIQLGLCLFQEGKHQDAIREWGAVLTLDSKNTTAAMYIKLAQSIGSPETR